ncbi:phage tail assembly chaperone G [Bacillus albus]|uniref:phage tail assembly chaperone G n=1 Tax=Bacillus albus TaxID=2026189 RepID=UPI00102024F0|nr:hypothetical protein [Bacillus albus]
MQQTQQVMLKLRQPNGKWKVFYMPNFISGLAARSAAQMADRLKEENVPFEVIEEGAAFVTEVYRHTFTEEEFLAGTHSQYLAVVLFAVCQAVLGKVNEAAALLEQVYEVQDKKKTYRRNHQKKNQQHSNKS